MKRKIIFTLFGLASIGFLIRFMPVDVPGKSGQRPEVKCSIDRDPRYDEDGFEIISRDPSCKTLEKINQVYTQRVKPIIKVKCLMCHGVVQSMPLYSKIPPAAWLVRQDISEAKKHMDMSYGFPFLGHGGLEEDLEAIKKVVTKNKMPPLRYKMMHWQSSLTEKETTILLEWVRESRQLLTQKGE